ncbi:hypothetical protein T08_3032 [Trichinella sp. T8]|nr:hypothetical protein T08_3032 [Trichinella sp. T8]
MRYSLKKPRLVQYFVVLGKSIFFHFRTISNKLKKVVSIWVEMCIRSSICYFSTDITHLIDQFLYYKNEPQVQMLLESETFPGNKWPLKLTCAYLNTQGSGQSETPLILIDDS